MSKRNTICCYLYGGINILQGCHIGRLLTKSLNLKFVDWEIREADFDIAFSDNLNIEHIFKEDLKPTHAMGKNGTASDISLIWLKNNSIQGHPQILSIGSS